MNAIKKALGSAPVFVIVGLATLAGCATSPPSNTCKELQGVWEGQMTPGGPISISFNDSCSYTWSGAFNTSGALSVDSTGGFTYANQAGSRGVVAYKTEGQRKNLVWRNIYTGNSYIVDVTK